MAELLKSVARRADRYQRELNDHGVALSADAMTNLGKLHQPLPEYSVDPGTVLALLDEIGSPVTVASAGGRYFGFVTGCSLPAALATNSLAGAWDRNVFSVTSFPAAAGICREAVTVNRDTTREVIVPTSGIARGKD